MAGPRRRRQGGKSRLRFAACAIQLQALTGVVPAPHVTSPRLHDGTFTSPGNPEQSKLEPVVKHVQIADGVLLSRQHVTPLHEEAGLPLAAMAHWQSLVVSRAQTGRPHEHVPCAGHPALAQHRPPPMVAAEQLTPSAP